MTKADKRIPLVECFGPTVQGEGSVIGQQTFFLRFGLCDYDCTMCDSRHAVDPFQVKANAQWLTQQEIFSRFYTHRDTAKSYVKWVTYSGGNPCIHDLAELTFALKSVGCKIAVETQGTFAPNWLWNCDIITVSPKGPGMGEKFDRNIFRKFFDTLHLKPGFNIKVVVFDDKDLVFARQLIEDFPWIQYNPDMFFLSQGNGYLDPGNDVNTLSKALRLNYLQLLALIQKDPYLCQVKFLPQWHVWLWGHQKGV